MGKSALISGITGVTGRSLALHLEGCGDWDHVYGISRREIDFGKKIETVRLDLTDAAKVKEGVSRLPAITHVFFCAFQATESEERDVEVNCAMFTNTVEGLEAAGAQLQHVHFLSGTKWYGLHLGGGCKTPAREDDPRSLTPNFYYDFEDYCISRVKAGAKWTWGSVRPNPVIGFSTGSVMNLSNTIAVYACLCKELGLPFRSPACGWVSPPSLAACDSRLLARALEPGMHISSSFPGSWAAYTALLEVCDSCLLAKAQAFIATAPGVANTSYNVSNGDVFRWSEVWPKLGAYFGLEAPEPQKISLAATMQTPVKEAVWEKLKKQHDLRDIAYNSLATWGFGDWVFGQERDWFANVTKLRKAGFHEMTVDTAEMFIEEFERLRADKIIPK